MPLRAKTLTPFATLLLALGVLLAPAVPRAQPAEPRQPQARELTVVNETDRRLERLFVWRSGTPAQGEDRLGTEVLAPQASTRVPLGRFNNCNWEIRAVFEDGEEVRRRVDVCRAPRTVLAEAGPRREIELANDSDIELRELYLSVPGAAEEGPDRLGTATVPPGDTFKVRLRGDAARPCVFDLRAVFADDSVERRARLDLCRAPRIAFGDPSLPVREVPVLNRARRTLRELYASPAQPEPAPDAAQRAWGPDRLGTSVIEPRQSFRMRVRSRACSFDLRAVFDDETVEMQRSLDLCTVQGVVFGDRPPEAAAAPHRVTLANRHGRTIQQIYLSPNENRDWGDDVLGNAVLPVGERFEARMSGGCRADLRIVFEGGGGAEERRDIDICTTPAIVLRPGWTVEARLDGGGDKAAEPAAGTPVPPAAPAAATPPAPAAAVPAGRIRLRNAAALPVVELYADAPGAASRGPDRLGQAVLGAGGTLDLAAPEGLPAADRCRADLTAVFRDGRELRLANRDLCTGEEVVLQ